MIFNPIYVKKPSGTHIYGVEWDGTATSKWTRTDMAKDLPDPVPYVGGATAYASPFDPLMPWAGMVKEERAGGSMVAIPKFWYTLTQLPSGGLKIQIADGPTNGFSVSPAHMDRGDGRGERDVVYIGRYHCDENWKSATGQMPKHGVSLNTGRAGVHSLGENIWLQDFAMRFTIWLLYLVEFADWDSQEAIGYGAGNGKVGTMGYTDAMPYHTGTSITDRSTPGYGTQYRNIEGLWDNVTNVCDGCYYSVDGMLIALDPSRFDEDSAWINIGKLYRQDESTAGIQFPSAFTVTNIGGFVMFLPDKENEETRYDIYSCDKWEYREPDRPYTLNFGGAYNSNATGGIFSIGTGNVFGGAYQFVGARIMELP